MEEDQQEGLQWAADLQQLCADAVRRSLLHEVLASSHEACGSDYCLLNAGSFYSEQVLVPE